MNMAHFLSAEFDNFVKASSNTIFVVALHRTDSLRGTMLEILNVCTMYE